MQPPHSRSNFLSDNGLILVGARPETSTLADILKIKGLSLIVNLEDDDNSAWYSSSLFPGIELLRIPTKSGSPPLKPLAVGALEKIRSANEAEQSVYIHCNGGHGRAGTLGAYVLGKLHDLDASEAISELERRRLTRPDQSRNYIPTPETNAQVKFLVKELGLKPGHKTPDRSDRSWLRIVRQERKKREASAPHLTASNVDLHSMPPPPKRMRRGQDKEVAGNGLETCQTAGDEPLLFYTDDASFPEFSNFFKLSKPFVHHGKRYPTSEHAFQAAKFDYVGASQRSLEYAAIVASASTPNIARVLACQQISGGYPWRLKCNNSIREYGDVVLRSDWEAVKVEVMREILLAKFSSDNRCKSLLLSTDNRTLVEHTPRDSFWGDGGSACTGQNILGKLLMETRRSLILSNNMK